MKKDHTFHAKLDAFSATMINAIDDQSKRADALNIMNTRMKEMSQRMTSLEFLVQAMFKGTDGAKLTKMALSTSETTARIETLVKEFEDKLDTLPSPPAVTSSIEFQPAAEPRLRKLVEEVMMPLLNDMTREITEASLVAVQNSCSAIRSDLKRLHDDS